LSFSLGVPLSELREMSANDLGLYQQYTARRKFPGRRIELIMAQACMMIAQRGGDKNAKLQDFLFDPPEPQTEQVEDMTVEEIRAMHGFNPIKKRKPNV
jgi:hypothetical protein